MSWKIVYETKPAPTGSGSTTVGRRFGNAFNKEDRLFQKLYDGSKKMKSLDGAESVCKKICEKDPLCLAVFAWNMAAHVATADRSKPFKETGFSCVGLTASRIFGNYFSYDDHMGTLDASELKIALRNNQTLVKGDDYSMAGVYPMLSSDVNGFAGASRSTIKEFLWDPNYSAADYDATKLKCKIGVGRPGGVYNGACKHKATGYCMEEIPGTATCLSGFEHAGQFYVDNARQKLEEASTADRKSVV